MSMASAQGTVSTLPGVATGRSALRRRIRWILVGTAVLDLSLVIGAVALGWTLRLELDAVFPQDVTAVDALAVSAGPWIVLGWMASLVLHGSYTRRVFGSGPEEFRAVFRASLMTVALLGLWCYLINVQLSRGFVALTFLVGVPLLVLERYAARKVVHAVRARGHLQHRVVAVGSRAAISDVVTVLERERYVGYCVVAACVPADDLRRTPLPMPVLGIPSDVRRVCASLGADTVLVTSGAHMNAEQLRAIAWDIEGSGLEMIVAPSLTDIAGPRICLRPVAGLPLLHVEPPQAGQAGGLAKRAFDVVAAAALLLLLSPLMAGVALVIKAHDRGPVLFRQARVGRTGEVFEMLKFRSMVADAESQLIHVAHFNESDGMLFKIREDPRITPIGKWLRRYSMDELPQLFNVLRGQMSLVGPRPPLPTEVGRYQDTVHRRLLVRPGLTGLWQVSGRSELSWDEAVRLDLYYVDNWSMMSDLVIIARTVRAVLRSSGAY